MIAKHRIRDGKGKMSSWLECRFCASKAVHAWRGVIKHLPQPVVEYPLVVNIYYTDVLSFKYINGI